MVIMKFGGTSVQNADRLKSVASLITHAHAQYPVAVVLSAMKGTTDNLLEAATLAEQGRGHHALYKKIKERHEITWRLLSGEKTVLPEVTDTLKELEELLHGIELIQECTLRTKDLILSFGERLIAIILARYLAHHTEHTIPTQFVDTRNYIITNEHFGDARVHFDESLANLHKVITVSGSDSTPIITGFIAATKNGITTTLGRNGSDYTAALVGAAVNAQCIEIWTDVDGVLSADPRIVKEAFVLPHISYAEAMELSFYGATVIHPQTVVPAIEKNVPIKIKNAMNPTAKGTLIEQFRSSTLPVTGFASIRYASLLTVGGAGLSGNFYLLPKIFNVFAEHHVQPLMITQASSEHSICFIFQKEDAIKAQQYLSNTFSVELAERRIQSINVITDVSIISVIGANMRGSRGFAGRVFSTVGKEQINIVAIAQGSTEMNISFVVNETDEEQVLCLLHDEFFRRTANA